MLYYFFDDHDEIWEKERSTLYQVGMVGLEIVVIAIVAFWSYFIIRDAPPLFPVSKHLDVFVDSYISGIFFAYAMFLFLDNLSSKIQFLYHKFLGKQTHFMSRKTEQDKKM
jgi:hypothetical protein